jgi:transcriptional regulator CtsR
MKSLSILTNGFKNTLNTLTSVVYSEFSNENSLISDDVMEIIDNPIDKRKLDEAVDYLLNNKNIKEKEVELSNKTITISLG